MRSFVTVSFLTLGFVTAASCMAAAPTKMPLITPLSVDNPPLSGTPKFFKLEAQPLSESAMQAALAELRSKNLGLPIDGANVQRMKGSFYEMRGANMHEAVDILSPRNTPVLAVETGKIARLFTSRLGGLTIYEVDPTGKYIYYYAHLQKYADNLSDGDRITKGQVIGYVGTSGNAPPNTPHLHFSIGLMGISQKWWQTTSVDPYEVFRP